MENGNFKIDQKLRLETPFVPPVCYPVCMMKNAMLFPMVPAGLVLVGGALLLAGPWPVGLPLLVAGTGELIGALWSVKWD